MSYDPNTKTFSVSSEEDLNQAIADIDAIGRGGELSNGSYTINFTQDIALGNGGTGNIIDANGSALQVNGNTVANSAQLKAINLSDGTTLKIDGGAHTLSGGGTEQGFFVYDGTVSIDNLTISSMHAQGGSGAGGGAGLGGGLFIAGTNTGLSSGGNVTLSNVTFTGDEAQGGNAVTGPGIGGGGLGGSAPSGQVGGGGGGIGAAANGALAGYAPDHQPGLPSGAGIVVGAPAAAMGGASTNGAGGASGGGGGAGGFYATDGYSGGGGIGGAPGADGGNGGFGGGGGGVFKGSGTAVGGNGGFGGGGGSSKADNGGPGGFGGGGAGGGTNAKAAGGSDPGGGGFGGGNGAIQGAGGGGLGAGGAIFVQEGGKLTLAGNVTIGGAGGDNTVVAGTGANPIQSTTAAGPGQNGEAFASGIYLQGNSQSVTFETSDPVTSAPTIQTVSDAIGDDTGSAAAAGYTYALAGGHLYDTPYVPGSVGVNVEGSGSLFLSAANTYTGATILSGASTVIATVPGALPAASAFVVGNGSSLLLASNQTIASLADGPNGGGTVSAFLASDPPTLTLAGAANTSFSGTLTDQTGIFGQQILTLVKQGTGVQTLAGNSTFSGGTKLVGGEVIVGSNTALGTGTLAMSSGTTLGFSANNLTLANATTVSGGSAFDVAGGQTETITATISDGATTGQVQKIDAGTLALSGTNTYGGGTYLADGTVEVAADANLGKGGIVFGGGTLETTADGFASAKGISIGSNETATVQVDTGTTTLSGQITDALSQGTGNSGALLKAGTGTLDLTYNGNQYAGGTTIAAGTLELGAANAAGMGNIDFGSGQSTLAIDSGAQPAGGTFANKLGGFNASSTLDLKDFVVVSTSYANGTLTLKGTLNGATTPTTESYTFDNPSSAAFRTMSDSAGGTDVMVCFAAGARIRTIHGDIAVERLRLGDIVVTASGAHRAIRWLGSRLTHPHRHMRPQEAMPVRIAAHALGPDRPSRDLLVSPGHSLCLDVLGELLIPAGALVNGSTIQQIEVDEVTYWHVELDSHDVILAENLPAESYLDMGNRGFFEQAPVVDLAAGPDAELAQRTHADFCLPFVDGGPILDAVKAQLRRRAESLGWSQSDALEMHLVVDGRRLDPVMRDLTARFHLPADAKEVWLMSPTAQPRDTLCIDDARNLGLYIGGLQIDDGFEVRDVAIDDPLLCIGFHDVEDGARRWTAGRARLPTALWDGFGSDFYLRIDLAGRPVPRWVASTATARDVPTATIAA